MKILGNKIYLPIIAVGLIIGEIQLGRPFMKIGKCIMCLTSCNGSRLLKGIGRIFEDSFFGTENYTYHLGILSCMVVCYLIWKNKEMKVREEKMVISQNLQKFMSPESGDHRDLESEHINVEDFTEKVVDLCNKANYTLKVMLQIIKCDKKWEAVK